MKNTKYAFQFFCDFLKFGCFTFGGGWSIVDQMQKRYVEEQNYNVFFRSGS